MPFLTVIAGPNGSGKSTLITKLTQQGFDFGEYYNADDIATTLTGSPEHIAQEAQEHVRLLRARALDQRVSHSFETVMSHPSHIDHIAAASAAGFTTRLLFIATGDPLINVDRVRNRVENGGHSVPEDRIVTRYGRCMDNLLSALFVAEQTLIFDNSFKSKPSRAIATAKFDDSQNQLTIIHHLAMTFDDQADSIDQTALPVWWRKILARLPKDRTRIVA